MPDSPPIAVIVSRYNASITDRLLDGAREAYARATGAAGGEGESGGARSAVSGDGREGGLHVFEAPGAFELPFLARAAAATGRYRGVLALGCLIRGETRHDRYIAQAVAHGITAASLETRVPIAFGVLTTETAKQARERAGGEKGNKGAEAMTALLSTIAAAQAIADGTPGLATAPHPDKARKDASRSSDSNHANARQGAAI
ncbi:MAG: 6,7-dimethyl-8-ribityllumazine synthase [Phycisphaerales bacterium]